MVSISPTLTAPSVVISAAHTSRIAMTTSAVGVSSKKNLRLVCDSPSPSSMASLQARETLSQVGKVGVPQSSGNLNRPQSLWVDLSVVLLSKIHHYLLSVVPHERSGDGSRVPLRAYVPWCTSCYRANTEKER
jgi:hypothetical protein